MTLIHVATMAAEIPSHRPEIVAHRGASFDAPENTLASVRLGWEQNADAVEVDVYLTADKRVVCLHDKDLQRTAGDPRRVDAVTLAEVRELEAGAWKDARWAGEPIPLLRHVMMTVPAGKRLFVEIKGDPEIVPHLVQHVRNSGLHPGQIVFISFNADSCREVKRALPAHKVLFLSGFKEDNNGVKQPTIDQLIAQAKELGVDGLDLSHKGDLTAEDVRRIREAGLFLAMYTINEPDRATHLHQIGVQSITTDKPALMLELFGQASPAQ